MKKIDIIINYLGLDEPFYPECGGDYSEDCHQENENGTFCAFLDTCERETTARKLLSENKEV